MSFQAPYWFILLPIVFALGWMFFRHSFFKIWRILIVILVIIALATPVLNRHSKGLDLWVLVDRSDSAAPFLAPNISEWEELIRKGKGANDRLFFIDYAGEISKRQDNVNSPITNKGASQTGEAIFTALSSAESNRNSKILLITDGYSTDSISDLSAKLKNQNIQLDYRLVRFQKENDVRVEILKVPSKGLPLEKFLVEGIVTGPEDVEFEYQLTCNDQVIDQGKLKITDGVAFLRRTDSQVSGGLHRYEFKIIYSKDSVPGNNQAEALIDIQGGPRVLLLSAFKDDPFRDVLEKQGFEVQHFNQFKNLNSTLLTGTRLVVINNVPAWELPEDFTKGLNFYVTQQGGGLIMCGGKFSFGTGGYYQSSVDDLLPVSVELKNEHRKLKTAMCIVMDRSGSMAASVGLKTKMELANEGAAQTVDLLNAMDSVAVFAVDTDPHSIVPLTLLNNPNEIKSKVRKVQSEGGGIYVYTGLKAAWDELKKAEGQKHIILFTDAADSEEPGQYISLIEKIRQEGGSISVIALGTEADSDAEFIKDVAKRGNGRIFFTEKAENLPSIFAQETVSVARSSFAEKPTKTTKNKQWLKISTKDLAWLESVNGYNITYLKEGANCPLIAEDEYKSPLVSWWQIGSGRTAAITFPIAGDYSKLIRNWSDYGSFLQTLSSWVAAPDVPAGLTLRSEIKGNSLNLDLYFNEDWGQKFSKKIPEIVLQSSLQQSVRNGAWRRLAPNRYQTIIDLKIGETLKGVVKLGEYGIPFGPLKAGIDMEWAFSASKIQDLRNVSKFSGGDELVDFQKVWQRRGQILLTDISSWFLTIALILFLLELYISRTYASKKNKILTEDAYVKDLLAGLEFEEDSKKSKINLPEELEKQNIDHGEATLSRRGRFERAKVKRNNKT